MGYKKWTDEEISLIRALAKTHTIKETAAVFNVSFLQIKNICSRLDIKREMEVMTERERYRGENVVKHNHRYYYWIDQHYNRYFTSREMLDDIKECKVDSLHTLNSRLNDIKKYGKSRKRGMTIWESVTTPLIHQIRKEKTPLKKRKYIKMANKPILVKNDLFDTFNKLLPVGSLSHTVI